MCCLPICVSFFSNYYFLLLNEFITFIVVQWSSQPNFIAFPSPNPSASPHRTNCLLWKPWVFQSLGVSICSTKKFIVSFFKIPSSIYEDMGSIPGLSQWVKDPVLPWAVVYIADSAQIPHCCACRVGRWLQLQFDPSLGISIYCGCGPKKTKNKIK